MHREATYSEAVHREATYSEAVHREATYSEAQRSHMKPCTAKPCSNVLVRSSINLAGRFGLSCSNFGITRLEFEFEICYPNHEYRDWNPVPRNVKYVPRTTYQEKITTRTRCCELRTTNAVSGPRARYHEIRKRGTHLPLCRPRVSPVPGPWKRGLVQTTISRSPASGVGSSCLLDRGEGGYVLL